MHNAQCTVHGAQCTRVVLVEDEAIFSVGTELKRLRSKLPNVSSSVFNQSFPPPPPYVFVLTTCIFITLYFVHTSNVCSVYFLSQFLVLSVFLSLMGCVKYELELTVYYRYTQPSPFLRTRRQLAKVTWRLPKVLLRRQLKSCACGICQSHVTFS